MTDAQTNPLATADASYLVKLAETRMPYGKYEGMFLVNLPEPYVVWMSRNGFPKGELGKMLMLVHEIKVNGLEYLFAPLLSGRKS